MTDAHIAEPLRRLSVPIADLTPDPANARKHGQRNLDAIKASLAAFGQRKPLVVQRQGMIVRAGNGTMQAAKALGWEHIAAVVIDEDSAQAVQFAIADNRTAELAEWDDETLASLLDGMDEPTRDMLAFDDKELAGLMRGLEPDEIVEDEAPEPPADPITQPGDLWTLGQHRLLCGDARKHTDLDQLMAGQQAHMVFADPPYGMSYQSNFRTASPEFGQITGDDAPDFAWVDGVARRSDGWVFVWTTWKVLRPWLDGLATFGDMTNLIVWHKPGGSMGDLASTFSTDYEVACVFHRGAKLCGKRIGSVWRVDKGSPSAYQHPTQKPVQLAAEAIDKTTYRNNVVLDPFLGSGTTLIAAEQLSRTCYGMEISPAYCDVIVQRWENLTGQKAVRNG